MCSIPRASLSRPRCIVVYGHGGEAVRARLCRRAHLQWALQAEQKGTGHAVMQAMPDIPDDHLVLVLYGDVPLLARPTLARADRAGRCAGDGAADGAARRPDRLRPHRCAMRAAACRPSSSRTTPPPRSGASPRQYRRDGRARRDRLRGWLASLRNDNAQGEYYLTDIVAMAVKDRVAVRALMRAERSRSAGRERQAPAGRSSSRCCARGAPTAAMLAGATLADPARFEQRGELVLGRDVFIDVNVRVRRPRRARRPRARRCQLRAARHDGRCRHADLPELRAGESPRSAPAATSVRLRACVPARVLADGVHIGNFVEVKNSRDRPGLEGEPPDLSGRYATSARASTWAPAPSPATTTAPTSRAP